VQKAVDFDVEKNLMRAHAVAFEDGGADVVFLVETQVVPILVVVNGAEGAVSARAASRRTVRRVATGHGAAARAAVGACRGVAGADDRESTRRARTRTG
jgi:hypothetical protein